MKTATINSKLRKLLGPQYGYRTNMQAPDEFGRGQHLAKARVLGDALTAAREERDALEKRLLDVPEYRALCAKCNKLRKEQQQEAGNCHSFPITVGTTTDVGGIRFFSVKAQGDTWAEVFAKLEGGK